MIKKSMDIYFKADIKDLLVDFLLENEAAEFYYFDCKRYSIASFLKSDKEQVSGRIDFGMFRLFLNETDFDVFLAKIKKEFKSEEIRVVQMNAVEFA